MNGSDIMENICVNENFDYQLMEKYVKQNDYDSAKKIAEKYPDDEIVQYELISICIETKRFEEGIKVALKYPDSKIIEEQLMYIAKKEIIMRH